MVDVTGLVWDEPLLPGYGPTGWRCRVAATCRVRAARAKRTAPKNAAAWDVAAGASLFGECRFCGKAMHVPSEILMGRCLVSATSSYGPDGCYMAPKYRYECRHVGACERRMSKGGASS